MPEIESVPLIPRPVNWSCTVPDGTPVRVKSPPEPTVVVVFVPTMVTVMTLESVAANCGPLKLDVPSTDRVTCAGEVAATLVTRPLMTAPPPTEALEPTAMPDGAVGETLDEPWSPQAVAARLARSVRMLSEGGKVRVTRSP
jgi:hypothetical protein